MLRLLLEDDFTADELDHPARGYAKIFQRMSIVRICKQYHSSKSFCEIGPHDHFNILEEFQGSKMVIDPYYGAGGAGLNAIPGNFPYPATLFRCSLGDDSEIIPDGALDFSFSVSVIEHVGQAESNYDCTPTETPPDAQELLRDRFCSELFRVSRPGSLTIHSVDHAARNLSFVHNFLKAGFRPIAPLDVLSVEECLSHPRAIRQRHEWLDPAIPMSEEEMKLHSVVTMGFQKPND